jgi:hypothetical protein
MARTAAAKTTTDANSTHGCACGCGETVERVFKQGHDQKLISKLASDLVYGDQWDGSCANILKTKVQRSADIAVRVQTVRDYVAAKLSEPLAEKFVRAATRAWELEKTKDARESAKAERKAAKAAKPTKKAIAARKTAKVEAAVPDEAPASRVGQAVVATATNDDVDAEEAAIAGLGAEVRIKVGKRTRTATVRGMNQAGKVTAVAYLVGKNEIVKQDGQFELVTN